MGSYPSASLCWGWDLRVEGLSDWEGTHWAKPLFDIAEAVYDDHYLDGVYLRAMGVQDLEDLTSSDQAPVIKSCPFVLIDYGYCEVETFILAVRGSAIHQCGYGASIDHVHLLNSIPCWDAQATKICELFELTPPTCAGLVLTSTYG